MTGRQAYGKYDTASEKQSDHYDDPLAELARIVSEGDEFLRQERLDAENLSDPNSDYDQTVGSVEAGDYQPAYYEPGSSETVNPDEVDYDRASAPETSLGADKYGAETYAQEEPVAQTVAMPGQDAGGEEFGEHLYEGSQALEPEPEQNAFYSESDFSQSDVSRSGDVAAPTVQIHLDPQELMDPSFDASSQTVDQFGQAAEAEPGYSDEYDIPAAWPEEGPYEHDASAPPAVASLGTEYEFADETGQVRDPAGDFGYDVENEGDYVGVAPPVASAGDHGTGTSLGDGGVTSRSLGFKAIAAVIALILVGGGGLFAYRSLGGGGSSGAPQVIKADTEPFKVRAVETAKGTSPSTPGAGVYQRLSGNQPSDKSQERIVVGKEQPVNVARTGGQRSASVSKSSLPKPVKTIVVKPDGTFVSRPEPQAGAGAKPNKTTQTAPSPSGTGPVANPNKPAAQTKSVARVVSTSPIRSVTAERSDQPATQEQATAPAKPSITAPQQPPSAAKVKVVASPTAGASPADTVRPADPSGTLGQGNQAASQGVAIAVTPRAKPTPPSNANQSRTFVANQQPAAAANPAAPGVAAKPQVAAVQASPAPAARTGGYIVQVSSQRSQKQALTAFADLQRRYPTLLGDKKPLIQKADLGDRGMYYRVRLGPYEKQAATRLCGQLTSAGGECFVRRN